MSGFYGPVDCESLSVLLHRSPSFFPSIAQSSLRISSGAGLDWFVRYFGPALDLLSWGRASSFSNRTFLFLSSSR